MMLPETARKWFVDAAATLILGTPAVFISNAAVADELALPLIVPRASVSSAAYRTPPQVIHHQAARPLADGTHSSREPGRFVQTSAQRPIADGPQIVPAAHRDVQQVSRRENRQSVQSELQRLYAEEGREMPQMTMPSYQQQPPSGSARTANSVPMPQARQAEEEPGFVAGLFDFARSKSRRSSSSAGPGSVTRPPAEPAPFSPPSYRDNARLQQQRQAQAEQLRRQQAAQAEAAKAARMAKTAQPEIPQQPSAQTKQSEGVIELKRVTPKREMLASDDFFPADETVVSDGNAAPATDAGDFFPAEVAATPAVNSAAQTAKAKMQKLLQNPAEEDADGFKLPVPTEEPINPEPAPAVASELVTTNVMPTAPPAGLNEPAPFFADEERAIDPNESMEVSALTGQTFDPSGADARSTGGTVSHAGTRMQQIAAREGVGLKGFCPVSLRDERRLADGKAAYVSYYRSKPYYFASAVAKETFDRAPATYAPASSGEDLTMKTLTGEVVDGSLDHSVWYKGKLYLFHSAENLKTFMAAPSAMAVAD